MDYYIPMYYYYSFIEDLDYADIVTIYFDVTLVKIRNKQKNDATGDY